MRRAYELETSLNEIVFQKKDGSFDTYLFGFPVKYEMEDGSIADKKPELVLNNTLSSGLYRFSSEAKNDVSLHCADIASNGVLYTSEQLNVSLRPKTTEEAEFGIKILEGKVDENFLLSTSPAIDPTLKASSKNVVPKGYSSVAVPSMAQSALSSSEKLTTAAKYILSEGNQMSVVPSYNGFEVSIDFAKNRSQEKFYFELSTNGKTLMRQDESYVLLDNIGNVVGIVGDAILTDESGIVDSIPIAATEIKPGEYLLSVTVENSSSATAVTLAVSDYYDYIQDTSIYSINSSTVAGTSKNLYVGYNSSRGIQRILIRANNWNLTSGYTVSNATLCMRDIMATDATTTVECRQFMGNIWSEASATWANVSANSYGTTVSSVTMNSDIGWSNGYVYSFDITSIAQGWCISSELAQRGLMLKASSSTEAATSTSQQYFASTQYGTEAYRPYITISAAYTDTVDNGIYYIRSAAGGYLTSTESSLDFSNVHQRTNRLSSDPSQTMNQLWRVVRVGNGYYTIRPYHYTPAGLTATQYEASGNTNADIYHIGYSDDMDSVPSYGMWNIGNIEDSNGEYGTYYSLSSPTNDGLVLNNEQPGTDGGNIGIADSTGGNGQKWIFEEVTNPPRKVLFYDSNTGELEQNPNRSIVKTDSKRMLAELDFDISMSLPGDLRPHQYGWSSTNEAIANVQSTILKVTGEDYGTAVIRVCYQTVDDVSYYAGFSLHVVSGLSDGDYYIQNAKSLRYMDIENQAMQNGTTIHQWSFHGGATSRWKIEMQTDGYYTIRSIHSGSTPYYLGVENDSGADGARVVLRSGAITDGMKWSFSITNTGSYKITPKVGGAGRILAVEYQYYQEDLGIDIKSLTYSDDGYDTDEWFLRNLEDTIEDNLYNMGLIDGDDIVSTDDGFSMITVSLANLWLQRGIYTITLTDDVLQVDKFYDDWYLIGLRENATAVYGMIKMREEESDHVKDANGKYTGDLDDPGVSVPFVALNTDTFLQSFTAGSSWVDTWTSIFNDVKKVTGPGRASHDEDLRQYFARPESDGAYLVAETYVKFIVSQYGSTINASQNLLDLFQQIEAYEDGYTNEIMNGNSEGALSVNLVLEQLKRIPNALEQINTAANREIYNFQTNQIIIQDPQNLSLYEKQAILACFTANVTFNSFAAEVVTHADVLGFSFLGWSLYDLVPEYDPIDVYEMALRADMSVGEEAESGFADWYYNLNSNVVQDQISAHGEY